MAMPVNELSALHEDLAIDIDRLHLVVTSSDSALPEPRMRAVVHRDLLDVCAVLAQHFAAEELSVEGMMEEHGGAALGALAELGGEHRRILDQLRQLAEAADTLPVDVLKLRIADALDVIGEHERGEVKLVDIGSHEAR
jgi:hypothetical protein